MLKGKFNVKVTVIDWATISIEEYGNGAISFEPFLAQFRTISRAFSPLCTDPTRAVGGICST